ncbi:hypothetical protein PACTADRAFT_48871, partial [Pachysolen tannophilus NRRL Y-2460]
MSESDVGIGTGADVEVQDGSLIDLPKYYPLHKKLIQEMNNIKAVDFSPLLTFAESEIDSSLNRYIDSTLELNEGEDDFEDNLKKKLLLKDEVIINGTNTYELLSKIIMDDEALREALRATKGEINNRFRNEEPLSFETLKLYQDYSSNDIPMEIVDLLNEKNIQSQQKNLSSAKFKKFHNRLQVYIDPFAVVTDNGNNNDNDNDDNDEDVEIAGGSVELTCPISKQIMENPVITECGHTFEQTSLRQYKNEASQADKDRCPVCGQKMKNI